MQTGNSEIIVLRNNNPRVPSRAGVHGLGSLLFVNYHAPTSIGTEQQNGLYPLAALASWSDYDHEENKWVQKSNHRHVCMNSFQHISVATELLLRICGTNGERCASI